MCSLQKDECNGRNRHRTTQGDRHEREPDDAAVLPVKAERHVQTTNHAGGSTREMRRARQPRAMARTKAKPIVGHFVSSARGWHVLTYLRESEMLSPKLSRRAVQLPVALCGCRAGA
jgi:hypothetical protein